MHTSPLRELPSVDSLLRQPAVASLLQEFPRGEVLASIRAVIHERRAALRDGAGAIHSPESWPLLIREKLQSRSRPNLRRVINATGIVLHTGLGRAPLAEEAIEAITNVAAGYSNLELDLTSGERGDRHANVVELLRELTGAEDAVVVNNNAAATFLALNSLARDRGVIVSRGQLVEIGGSYRMPDIMSSAACRMIEVGTTNRTHLRDYEQAITPDVRILLRVHTSNYRISGFVTSPDLAELVTLARKASSGESESARDGDAPQLVVVDDLGSGLIDRLPIMVHTDDGERELTVGWDEPTVRESVEAGCDVTLFSGDKLLGGPQAGIILGRAELIRAIRKNPLMRTYRPDKLTLAGLEATLRLYRDPAALGRTLPIYQMLSQSLKALDARARRIADEVRSQCGGAIVEVRRDRTFAGGGSLPAIEFDTCVVSVRPPNIAAADLAAALRDRDLPIICRIHDDAIVLDSRTIRDEEIDATASAVSESIRERS
ncbi:MAG: L-seryl-tRNA(Sec) selenium transferase [Phycisphaerae bacterium]